MKSRAPQEAGLTVTLFPEWAHIGFFGIDSYGWAVTYSSCLCNPTRKEMPSPCQHTNRRTCRDKGAICHWLKDSINYKIPLVLWPTMQKKKKSRQLISKQWYKTLRLAAKKRRQNQQRIKYLFGVSELHLGEHRFQSYQKSVPLV